MGADVTAAAVLVDLRSQHITNTETRCYPLFHFFLLIFGKHVLRSFIYCIFIYIYTLIWNELHVVTRVEVSVSHVRQTRNNSNRPNEPVRCWSWSLEIYMFTAWHGVVNGNVFSDDMDTVLCLLKKDILFQSAKPTWSRLCQQRQSDRGERRVNDA